MTADQSDAIHKPVPLSECITGTLTLHFPGATVRRRMSLADGQTITQINNTDRSGDRLAWHHISWIQWDETKFLAGAFDPDEDLGWGLKPEDRARLRANGHPHGVLRSLLDHSMTKGGAEPAYSPYVLQHLHGAALTVSADDFGLLADYLEGEKGSRVLQAFAEGAAAGSDDMRSGKAPLYPDDYAEPDLAPTAGEPDGQESATGPEESDTAAGRSEDGTAAEAVNEATTQHDDGM
ncbi:hypothetical protein ABLE68_07155 [Nocardioides sp. CN2-186]|uniref:hypothetical protein n=1 Tax=Nocardioides tweenelious TaxID=3156607 RepID=UPI0032B5D111